MPTPIILTPEPVTLTATGAQSFFQPLWSVPDVSVFDFVDLYIGIFYLTFTVNMSLSAETSMQNNVDTTVTGGGDTDWVTLAGLTSQTGNSVYQTGASTWHRSTMGSGSGTNPGMLNYLRWRVDFNGAGTGVFFIYGEGRSFDKP